MRLKTLFCLMFLTVLYSVNAMESKASYSIKLPDNPTIQEKTAALELKNYLQKTVKDDIFVHDVNNVVFHIGNTEFARNNKIYPEKMENEKWRIKTIANNVILCGGGTRGTLYAVYHFLEDVAGIHWWNHYEEYVPDLTDLRIKDLNLKGKPFFIQRSIHRRPSELAFDGGLFAVRNRINDDGGNRLIAKELGDAFRFGPPYYVHTFYRYFPESYFKKHPEYFALRNGVRSAGKKNQLCLTNPDMQKAALEKLKAYIVSAEKEAKAKGISQPVVYDLSQNDCSTPCQCDACTKIVCKEKSEAGPLLAFINKTAAEIKKFRPGLLICTLAYTYTKTPPQTIKPLDNVMIRLCRTNSNPALPLSAPENAAFTKQLKAWSKWTKHLAVWDYGTTYSTSTGLPYANEFTLAETHKTYAENGVKYIFWEHEFSATGDMYTMKVWLEAKLMEDPQADFEKLYNLFMTKYYGKAAPYIIKYRQLLQDAMDKKRCKIAFMSRAEDFSKLLTFPVVSESHKLMDQAEKSVVSNPLHIQRVRRARLGLDRYSCIMAAELFREYSTAGGKPESFPIDRQAIAERAKNTHFVSTATIVPRYRTELRNKFNQEIDEALKVPLIIPSPVKFVDLEGHYYDYPAYKFSREKEITLVKDPDAETGLAAKISNNFEKKENSFLEFGCYTYDGNKILKYDRIKQIPKAGYNWYKLMQIVIPQDHTYIYCFMHRWRIKVFINNISGNSDGKTAYEVWANIKFTGPTFPHGREIDENAIYVERVIVKKK